MGTPGEMRGQLSAGNSMFIWTSNRVGEFEPGWTAAMLGVVLAVLLGGVGTIIVFIIWKRRFTQIVRNDFLEC
jgi:hypothetical protein